MRIQELFNNDQVKWNWDYKSDSEVEATFVIGKVQYKFYAYSSEPGTWDVEFKIVEGGPEGNRFGVTGTGNAAQVMSTVVSILKEFLKEYKRAISKLIFSAKEQSRRDLYARMVRRLLPDWDFEQFQSEFSLTAPGAE